ncbi:hypothetical protein I3843_06G107400 [Carya illinoinensis]|nr:hypothetical protein I3843_06G107400 [Carya illinoinensis]
MASLQVQGRISKLISKPLYRWVELRRCLSSRSLEDDGGIRERSGRTGGGDGGGSVSGEKLTDFPPEPIPNRPLRGQGNSKSDIHFRNRRPSADSDKDSFEFLEKFKLGAGGGLNKGEKFPNRLQQQQQQEEGKADTPTPPPAQDADEIFKKLKETGLIPNAVAMLDGLCKDGLVQEAMKLFGLMREKGTIPEVVIYTAVVDGFCKAHKFEDAKRIFRKMQNNGISPNAFSYSVLIQGLYQCDELDDAAAFCIEMLEAGHSPNITTFLGLVARLCLNKGVEEARTVIATLTQKGFFVNKKAIKEYMEKKPTHPSVWEAIFGNESREATFRF